MVPLQSLIYMEDEEKKVDDRHVVVLLLLRPKDDIADSILRRFNYLHQRSKGVVSIYLPGYGFGDDFNYADTVPISGPNNSSWYYSDACFIEVIDELDRRLSNWYYSGEPELIHLQNNPDGKGSSLYFKNYYCINLIEGIKKNYIRSFDAFMEQLIRACRKEVTSDEVVTDIARKNISIRRVLNALVESIIERNAFTESAIGIIKDVQFIQSCRRTERNCV